MKIKRVLRYYCNYCKKSGCGKAAMITHENHCTMNPDRKCRMCEIANNEQQSITSLFAALDKGGIKELRDASGDCPMCIYSVLRQTRKFNGKEIYEYDFDLKDEVRMFFDTINKIKHEREMASYVPY